MTFELRCLTYLDFDFKIYDANKPRYEVPQGGIFPQDPNSGFSFPIQLADIVFTYVEFPFSSESSENQVMLLYSKLKM